MDDDSPEINQNEIKKDQDKNKKDTSPDFFKDLEIFQSNENYNETNEILEQDLDQNDIKNSLTNNLIEEQINE